MIILVTQKNNLIIKGFKIKVVLKEKLLEDFARTSNNLPKKKNDENPA